MLPSLPKDFTQFRELRHGEFIILFVDTSGGGDDNTAGQFLSHKWLDVPLVYWSNVSITFATPLFHYVLEAIYDMTGVRPVVAFENNNGGSYEMERLARLNRNGKYRIYTMKKLDNKNRLVDTGKYGWDTTTASRPKMCQDLQDGIDGRLLHVYHRPTVDELFSFIVNGVGKPEADEGAHDDLVLSLAGVWQLYQTERPIMDDEGSGVIETVNAYGHSKEAGVLIVGEEYE